MLPRITVVSLGPGPVEMMTIESLRILENAQILYLRTNQHPCASYLQSKSIPFETMDSFYESSDDFDRMHEKMALLLWQAAAKKEVVYAVMDPQHDFSIKALRQAKPHNGKITVIPGISFTDSLLARLPDEYPHDTVHTVLASRLDQVLISPAEGQLICEIDSREIAGIIKLQLLQYYSDSKTVVFFRSLVETKGTPASIPLYELDRQKTYDHTVAVYLPPDDFLHQYSYSCNDLLKIMDILRDEHGCPWDKKQTHQSLRPYLIEEAYETVQTIDDGDPDALCEELGDVLLQIAFHASIAKQAEEFLPSDISTCICRKMIRRHPDVFSHNQSLSGSRDWDRIKNDEKGFSTQGQALQSVARALPALIRAAKVQKRAADVGFDWNAPEECIYKIHEEADELSAAISAGSNIEEEIGDLLFSCVNVARLAKTDPEELLHKAADKFTERFCAMEEAALADGKPIHSLTFPEMNVYWSAVKRNEANSRKIDQ